MLRKMRKNDIVLCGYTNMNTGWILNVLFNYIGNTDRKDWREKISKGSTGESHVK